MSASRAQRLLDWIKGRGRRSGPGRWLARGSLGLWKLARRLPLANRVCVPVRVDGHTMRIRAFSYDDLLTVSPEYEACIADILPPTGGVAVDVGAFIGRHALAYARAVGGQGRVVAVEPLPANLRLLEHNVRRNSYTQVTCLPVALGAAPGEIDLAFERETSTATAVRPLQQHRRVRQETLDSLAAQLSLTRLDLVKIDVEGAELAVLEGGRKILAASPQVRLVIEIHPWIAGPGEPCPVAHWLSVHGYAWFELHDGPRRFYVAGREITAPSPPAS